LTDNLSREVSLYLVDYTNNSRIETIEVLNAENGAVLSGPVTVSHFSAGEYLTWNVTGHVEFVVTRKSGPNAVVSGIFFGVTAPAATSAVRDTTTQGAWKGTYGTDGENVVGSSAASYPAYAQVSVTGNTTNTWAASTSNVSALQQPSGSGRVAADWQSTTSFTIHVNLVDDLSHEVSLYLVDYTNSGRIESIAVLNAQTGAALSAPVTVANFSGGEYLTWNVTGRVEFVVTDVHGPNAVVSGIFFGMTAPAASLLATDTKTQGNWIGVYGTGSGGGENVVGSSAANYPAYAQVSVTGNRTNTWAASTTNVRALQQPGGTGRVAADWQSSTSFTINVNLTDKLSHEVSLYLVDYTFGKRSESIEVLNAETGTVLSGPVTVSNFSAGEYLTWELTGHVEFVITCLSGPNAVVSGIFFSSNPPASVAPSASASQNVKPGSSTALTALVADSFSNPLSGVPVTFTIQPNAATGSSGAFVGNVTTVTVPTSANGLAVAPLLEANDDAGTFTVTASVGGIPETTFTITIL
jgi:hypothetical protein